MRDIRFPAQGYDGAPDWRDLRFDFCGLGGFQELPAAEVKRHAAGRLALLAVPYFGLTRGREAAADQARNWQAQLLPEISCLSPALDVQLMLDCGEPIGDLADDAAAWGAFVRRYFRFCEAVIIPPIEGWDQARDVYQIAATALSVNIPFFLIKEGQGNERQN